MTDNEFFAAAAAHDWTYAYSDDGSVYRRGQEARAALQAEAEGDPVKTAILHDWHAYVFSGEAYGNEAREKPVIWSYVVPNDREISNEIRRLSPATRAVVIDALRVRAMDFVEDRLDPQDGSSADLALSADLAADLHRALVPQPYNQPEIDWFDPDLYSTVR